MKTPILCSALVLLGACGSRQVPANTGRTAVQSSAELDAFGRDLIARVDRGDYDFVASHASRDAVNWDLGDKGQPVSIEGAQAVKDALLAFAEQARQADLKLKTDVVNIRCHSVQVIGYCTIEFDQVVMASGQALPVSHQRGTLVAAKENDDWRWTHWHVSPR